MTTDPFGLALAARKARAARIWAHGCWTCDCKDGVLELRGPKGELLRHRVITDPEEGRLAEQGVPEPRPRST